MCIKFIINIIETYIVHIRYIETYVSFIKYIETLNWNPNLKATYACVDQIHHTTCFTYKTQEYVHLEVLENNYQHTF
jgi:hypothetical protein